MGRRSEVISHHADSDLFSKDGKLKDQIICTDISGSHGGEYDDESLMRYSTV
jgi:hypothetical protein